MPDYVAYVAPHSVAPLSTAGPTGYTPAQIRQAYGFDKIAFNNGTVAGDGSGTTIAIVDAYDDPKIANDLHQFDLQFGLPDPAFTKVNRDRQHHGVAHGERRLGHGNRARRGVGPRDRPEGQHPAGRGQQRLVQRPAYRRRLRSSCHRRCRRVDELGRRRVLQREARTTAISRPPAATAG